MKICLVTSSFPRYKGDYSGYFIYEQALALSSKHEVHIIYPSNLALPDGRNEPFYRHPLPYPFKTYPLAQVSGLDLLNILKLLVAMAREIRHVRREYEIDLFYAFWTIPSAFMCSLLCGKTPYLAGLMGSDVRVFGKGGIAKPFIKRAIKRASRIVALSSDLKREAVALGAKEGEVSVIPSGVDISMYKPRDKQALRARLGLPGGLILLYVGSLFRLKRVDRIIKASANLGKDFNFHVVIVGDGPERQELESMTRRLGMRNVLFKGRVPHEDVPLYTAASDIFLLLSETEGLPSCVQEAMASGNPVIASNVGGLPDMVIDGVTGYLVEDEKDVEESLTRFMSSPALVSELGLNALNFARQYLSTGETLKQVTELCESIVYDGKYPGAAEKQITVQGESIVQVWSRQHDDPDKA